MEKNNTYPAVKVVWFIFGSFSCAFMSKYNWWGLLTVPIWFVIDYYLEKLWNYKPEQRTIKDFQEGNKND